MTNVGRVAIGLGLVASLAMTGCGGTVRMASAKTCAAHGGTYDASAKACTTQASTKSAAQICQAEGGYYDPGSDVCEVGRE